MLVEVIDAILIGTHTNLKKINIWRGKLSTYDGRPQNVFDRGHNVNSLHFYNTFIIEDALQLISDDFANLDILQLNGCDIVSDADLTVDIILPSTNTGRLDLHFDKLVWPMLLFSVCTKDHNYTNNILSGCGIRWWSIDNN